MIFDGRVAVKKNCGETTSFRKKRLQKSKNQNFDTKRPHVDEGEK